MENQTASSKGKKQSDIKRGIEGLLDKLSIQSGESVLIVADTNTETIGRAIFLAACKRSPETSLLVMLPRTRHGEEPTKVAGMAMRATHVAIIPTTYSMTHSNASHTAMDAGCRVMSMAGCTEDIFRDGSLEVDCLKLRPLVEAIGQQMSAAKMARVLSAKEAVMTIPLARRRSVNQTGVCDKPGCLAVLPNIETAVSPLEEATSGVLTVDGAVVPGGPVTEPIAVHFRAGRIVDIEGGDDAARLRDLLSGYADPNVFCPCELGVGLNPNAKIGRGSLLEDEGEFGTLHIGLGEGRPYGSNIRAKAHIDLICRAPTLELDGEVILQNKEFMLSGGKFGLKEALWYKTKSE